MLPLPVKLQELTEEELKDFKKYGFNVPPGSLRANPGDIKLTPLYKHFGPLLYNFEFRTDDVCLLSWPKSGTTWTSEVLWAMMHPNELEVMDQKNIHGRAFFIDKDFAHPIPKDDLDRFERDLPGAKREDGVILQLAKIDPSPRLLWSHMPVILHNPNLFNTCKVVYVVRNPKDVAVSSYHFVQGINFGEISLFEGDFQQFARAFVKGMFPFMGNYWEHIRQAWAMKDNPNFHIIFYEDMKKDILKEIKKLKAFLQVDLTDEQITKIIEATSFSTLKARDAKLPVAEFLKAPMFRKGQVGDSKNMFTPELDALFDAWIKENSKGLGVEFKYE